MLLTRAGYSYVGGFAGAVGCCCRVVVACGLVFIVVCLGLIEGVVCCCIDGCMLVCCF